MSTNNPLSTFRRLCGIVEERNVPASVKNQARAIEKGGSAPKPKTGGADSKAGVAYAIAWKNYCKAHPNSPHCSQNEGEEVPEAFVAEQRQLAGFVKNPYESWKRSRDLSEDISTDRAKIRSMVNFFENSSIRVTHLPTFDTQGLMEAAAKGNIAPEVAKHHIKAVQASNVAMKDRHASSDVAHMAHKNASQLHKNAADMMRKSGDAETAAKHDAWAKHHDTHAAHHKTAPVAAQSVMGDPPKPKKGTGTVVGVSKDPFPSPKSAEKAPDTEKVPSTVKDAPKSKTAMSLAPTMKSDAPPSAAPSTKTSAPPTKKSAGSPAPNPVSAVKSVAQPNQQQHQQNYERDMHIHIAHTHMADAVRHHLSGDHEKANKSMAWVAHSLGQLRKQKAAAAHKETLKSA